MRIAISGPPCCGKSNLVEEFKNKWPRYKSPSVSYQGLLPPGTILGKESSAADQRAVLNAMIDSVQVSTKKKKSKFTIFDGCVTDNIAHALWFHSKEVKGFDASYIIDAKTISAVTLSMFDVIFCVSYRPEQKKGEDDLFVQELSNISEALITSYEKGTGAFYPLEDCPAVIRLEGPPDMWIPQISLYIKEDGSCFGEKDGSLLSGLDDLLESEED